MTEQPVNLDAILNKIALLKNLASQPGTPAEAASATAAIEKLMLRYNLSQFQIDGAKRLGFDGPRVGREFYQATSASWHGALINGIAGVNFCQTVYLGSGRFAIIGHTHNIAIVTGLYEYLRDEIDRLADIGWANAIDDGQVGWRDTARTWKGGFRHGARAEVLRRLREEAKANRAAEEGSSALVPVIEQEVANALAEYYPRLESRSGSARINANGYGAGKVAGAGINLAKQIGG